MKKFIKDAKSALSLLFVIAMLITIFVAPVIWFVYGAVRDISASRSLSRQISHYKEIIDDVDPQGDLDIIQEYIFELLDELPDDEAAALLKLT